jgi:metal-sulfur cluster biosynthetic enzyme/nitrite reductase/ring-hydroxylating ferredoxin subunit
MDGFVRVADVGTLPDPGQMLVEVENEVVALFHVDGAYHCIDDVCTHDGGTLADGPLTGHVVACPRHGATFDVRTGAALTMPAVRPTRCHDVRVADGGVWVRLRTAAADAASSAAGGAGVPLVAPAVAGHAGGVAASPAPFTPVTPAGLSEDAVREMLREVKDPELFVNIVDLGLIYGVTVAPAADDPAGRQVSIDMTMTSPACPAGPQLIADTKRAVGRHEQVRGVEVRIVMDPPWTPDRMTDAARDQLGIF